MARSAWVSGVALLVLANVAIAKPPEPPVSKPSRAAEKGCAWERFSDATLHLEAWVERCDYGFRKIDFVKKGNALAARFSDGGGSVEPVVEVLDLLPGETPENGLKRLYAAHTPKAVAARCKLVPDPMQTQMPKGVKRYTFVPKPDYEKELKAKQDPNDVPDPPCGDWGESADSIQYFEAHPGSGVAKVLLVHAGQDTPPFDEDSLQLR